MKNKILLCLSLVFTCLLLSGCGCSKEKVSNLVGTWKHEKNDAAYVFNEDGTGSYLFYGSSLEFTYKDNGSVVTLLFKGDSESSEHPYILSETMLKMEDSFGNEVLYIKN